MTIRLTLVVPPTGSVPLPDMGVAHVAASIRANGIPVTVCDANVAERRGDDWLGRLRTNTDDIVGIAAAYSVYHDDYLSCLRRLREARPSSFLIVGGHHASNAPESFLGPGLADVVVIGEGELTILEVLKRIAAGRDWRNERGVCYQDRSDKAPVRTPPRPLIGELDALPFPALDLLPIPYYEECAREAPTMLYRGRISSWVFRERGCPFSCSFCSSATVFGKRPRAHSVEYLLRLIDDRTSGYSLDHIYFLDDTFSFDRQRTIAFCEAIIKADTDLIWGCQTRVDCVDAQLLSHMARAGCALIEYGVESMNPAVLRSLRKGITPEQAWHAIRATHAAGIPMQVNLMLGNTSDTVETLEQSITFGQEILARYGALPCYWIATPLPGTAMYLSAMHGSQVATLTESTRLRMSPPAGGCETLESPLLSAGIPLKQFRSLVERAWTQSPRGIEQWFRGNRLLSRALKFYGLSIGDCLAALFPSGVGNFIGSRFFTNQPSTNVEQESGHA